MEQFLNKLKEISDFIIRLDKKIGFKKVLLYVLLVLGIIGIFNFKTIIRETIEVVSEITEENHNERMKLRDQLLLDLQPILTSVRAETGADRVLYFEYHNSKENLVGIPFKYADLVQQACSYTVVNVPENLYKDINTGSITNLYEAMRDHIVSSDDSLFCYKYPGAYELFTNDGSSKQVFVSIPGIDQPIGMLVFEWVNENHEINLQEIDYILGPHGGNYLSRINGLIMSKTNQKN